MVQHLNIRLGTDGDLLLKFKIRDTPVAQLWIERMQSRGQYPLDHPDRFYNFGTLDQERQRAVEMITRCINTINAHEKIIHREFEYTQDCLNYLHNIFEVYHGLLDCQDTEYWHNAPEQVRVSLANLNLAVHRCESVDAGPRPQFICTWYGMPKVKELSLDLQKQFGTPQLNFGTIYLTYCEIGKTLEDLTHDNDAYIGKDAFKPFSHYSADFKAVFHDRDLTDSYSKVQEYINEHQDFFLAYNITSVYNNVQAQPLRFPVADLVYTGNREHLLSQIAQRQWVYKVTIE
jgi:hypothetical protein